MIFLISNKIAFMGNFMDRLCMNTINKLLLHSNINNNIF